MDALSKFEADLWEAADNLRANSKLTSSDYFMPVLGVIFLRHAANRFDAAAKQIAEDQAAGRMPKRKVQAADYIRRRALWLPETARFDYIMEKASVDPAGLPKLVTEAMNAIEADFEPLLGVLPKDYGIFEPKVLEDLMRLFNSEQIKSATGDVFGRIYEYFLAKFSIQKAHDNGEFFTPVSLVQTIVNVIEPDHGIVFDPAIGSAGMAVQSSHFIEDQGGDTARQVVIYGQEKNRDTIRIAKMNLAVHGLEGKIAEAITYYQDEHNLAGKCDFVMANPPFNVDLVDAERIAKDPRLPFGLPGVNKAKKVSNGNYLWISYFWSYLSEKGRAGFVMSSQASSAGNDEKEVRKKIVETGDVDVMISIRSGFFYTRTVPCELWHLDRNKPANRKDKVLMIDARNIGQLMKGSRKVYEFTPEQLKNIAAIVWLYRGQQDRFVALGKDYLAMLRADAAGVDGCLREFGKRTKELYSQLARLIGPDGRVESPYARKLEEWRQSLQDHVVGRGPLTDILQNIIQKTDQGIPESNQGQHQLGKSLDDLPAQAKATIKLMATMRQTAGAVVSLAEEHPPAEPRKERNGEPEVVPPFDLREAKRALKQFDQARDSAAEQIKRTVHWYRQGVWLRDRFPEATFLPVPGLCKIVARKEIAPADWSLTPGRYVGVAPPLVDEDFDFEQAITELHTELAALNIEAYELSGTIQKNFEELGT